MRNRRNIRNSHNIKEFLTNKKFIRIIVCLSVIILGLMDVLIYRKYEDNKLLIAQGKELEAQTDEIFSSLENNTSTSSTTVSQSTSASLAVVGDILCGTDMLNDANNEGKYNFISMFSNVLSYTQNADIAIGTLETNFTNNEYSGLERYNSPTEFLTAIKNTGIDLVSVAHNHELDYGAEGLNTTVQTIQDNGISVTGISNNPDNTNSEFTGNIKEVKGIKVAFLAYTYGISNEDGLSDEDKAKANIYSEDRVNKDMEYAKANSNYIIVIMHWGDINNSSISTWQNDATNYLINSGADMILGSHPSVVEPMEIRQNSEGKNVLIAYSLGNYISSLKYENADVELILNIKLYKGADSDKASLQKVDYTPIYVLDNGENADNRFELYNMKSLALEYSNGDTNKISRTVYNKLVTKLDWLDEIITK